MPPKKKTAKKDQLIRPKGMRDIQGNAFYAYQGFFEKAAEVAIYYGFRPIETPMLERREVFTSGIGAESDLVKKEMYELKTRGGAHLVLRPEGTAPIMRSYIEDGMHSLSQPVMLYYYGPFFRHERPQRGRFREFFQFGLEVIGTAKGVADAMIIRMTMLTLEEAGLSDLTVLINSIGHDKCRDGYLKELTEYYRGKINRLCTHCRDRLRRNPLRLLDCKNPLCQEFKEDAPESIQFLCSTCKEHFKRVLEYLDIMEIPYRIDHTLVRGIDYYTNTVFEVVADVATSEAESDQPQAESGGSPEATAEVGVKKPGGENNAASLSFAGGGRYNDLARHLGAKRDVPAVGVAFGVDRIITSPGIGKIAPRIVKKPKVYFIPLGSEAKLKSFSVIETLRAAKIPVAHALSKDKLSVQLAIAERMKIPHAIILGQKESMDGTVIVRDMKSRSQETVKIESLSDYLKKKKNSK